MCEDERQFVDWEGQRWFVCEALAERWVGVESVGSLLLVSYRHMYVREVDRVQAMMAYELMRAKISCALWLETRDVRLFDSHRSRRSVLDDDSNSDQLDLVREEME